VERIAHVNDASYRFRVGAFECVAFNDGMFPYSAPLFFPTAPAEPLAAALHEHQLQPDPIPCPWTSLLIDTGQHRVLVDTGGGAMGSQVVPGTGQLLHLLQQQSVSPESIDTVILTHGHPDHIGGLTDGSGQVVFPRAQYVISQTEWAFWTAEATLTKLEASEDHLQHLLAAFARANLPPIRDRLRLVHREEEVVAGVQALPAPGHTPGHLALAITSGTYQLLYLVDTALHPIHLEHPEWRPVFDVLPDEAAQSRRQFFDRAAADHALTLVCHFPFPGLGHVAQSGNGWAWQPLDEQSRRGA